MGVIITYFVHGTTKDNELDLATGWLPGELSELGIRQSEELKKIIRVKFDLVICSDLGRAIQSALITFGNYETDPRLREIDYGDNTLRKASEFKNDLKKYVYTKFPNGESYDDVEMRVANFLEGLKQDYQGKHIAIVSHQAPQLAFEVLLRNKTWHQAIDEDWRNEKEKRWQPGWEYVIE